LKLRFNLKWLLVMLALSAGLAWWFSKVGMTVAHVIVVNNQLHRNSQGTIDGQLQCRLVEANEYSFTYSDFLCVLYHVDREQLLDLKKDDRARIEYRQEPVWPFTELGDPYRIFLNQHLGIPDQEILGSVRRSGPVSRGGSVRDEDWMEIIVRGGESSADK
jgi:hypothetical protein